MLPPLRLTGAQVLLDGGLQDTAITIAQGRIVADQAAGQVTVREVDLRGFYLLPGIVDIHGDGFEHHLAPRRGAMKDVDQGLVAAEAQLASNGITTAVLAQFYSWEGGMRGREFAEKVFDGLTRTAATFATDLRPQLRFETQMLDEYGTISEFVARHDIGYVVFNDHLPHEALSKGKRPPRLTGQALRIGRNPEKHLADMQAMHARMDEVPQAIPGLVKTLQKQGVILGSHDDQSPDQRRFWRENGVKISEFPETLETAEAAISAGDSVIMGGPNLVRGSSHKGNASAIEVVAMGYCNALASDYHYPSLRRAAFLLMDGGIASFAEAWRLISLGPARILGLHDRGEIVEGLRADLVLIDSQTRRICATISGGAVSYLSQDAAARFIG